MRGERRVQMVANVFARVCVQNYSGAQFIAPSQVPTPNTSPSTGPAGYWASEIRGSCGSTTLWPQFQSGCWPNYVRVKWVPWVFLTWVDSNLWVWLEPPFWAFHSQRGKTEENVSFVCGSTYRAYHYFAYLNEPWYYPLDHICRYTRQRLQTWHWWWHQSWFPISLGL